MFVWQVEVVELSEELNSKVSGSLKEQQRKYYLQQHLKAGLVKSVPQFDREMLLLTEPVCQI